MRSIGSMIDEFLGRSFEIDCAKIEVMGEQDHEEPYFSGPGSITGDAEGFFHFRLYNILEKEPKDLIRLTHVARDCSEQMRLFADDYEGTNWTGGSFFPEIQISSETGKCLVTGKFPQLDTRIAFTSFDRQPNTTTILYSAGLRLPMLTGSKTQTIRGELIECETSRHDRCDLDFDGALITVSVDEEKGRTILSTTYSEGWKPPYCEVGLADAVAFVSATEMRPRITIRGFEEDAIVFLRFTPEQPRTGMPRPIAGIPPNRDAFWKLFLAFLRYCAPQDAYFSTPLSRLFSELVPASTGTVHGLILSLVVAIEHVVDQIVEPSPASSGTEEIIEYVRAWTGEEALKNRAVGILSSFLPQTSANEKLRRLVAKRVVTDEQRKLWNEFRQKVAHGKLVDYDDARLMEKRNQLIVMFYRLALRLLNYQGPMTDYGDYPSREFDLCWDI